MDVEQGRCFVVGPERLAVMAGTPRIRAANGAETRQQGSPRMMISDRSFRRGATSLAALAFAALMPAPLLADVPVGAAPPGELPEQLQDVVPIDPELPAVEPAEEKKPVELEPEERAVLLGEGVASYYGAELAGNRTASGERFNPNAMTAAHRTLRMGTMVKVTNKSNGRSVVVRINDRGPFTKGRIIDVSRAAAERIAMIRSGTARVKLELVG